MSNHSESIWLPLLFGTASCVLSVACMPDEQASELGIYRGGQREGAAAVGDAGAAAPAPREPDASAPERPLVDASTPPPLSPERPLVDASFSPPRSPEQAGLSFAPIQGSDDADLHCYELKAHAVESPNQPFIVPAVADLYMNYTFRAPWSGTQVLRVVRPIVGAIEYVHRFRLFANPKATPAGVAVSDRDHRGAQLIATFMPGGEPVYFPEDTGMLLSDTASYTLEVHYNGHPDAPSLPDSSGFELCVTPRPSRFLLGLSQIGGDEAENSAIYGRCTRKPGDESVWVYGLRTQLDASGRHVRVTVHRASGPAEVVLDEDVYFDTQRSHATKFELRPGDLLDTTCSYWQPARLGPSVNDSACNVYAYHWPAYTLGTSGVESPEGVGTCRD